MPELTVDELATELIMHLEERMELGFNAEEEKTLEVLLANAIRNAEAADNA